MTNDKDSELTLKDLIGNSDRPKRLPNISDETKLRLFDELLLEHWRRLHQLQEKTKDQEECARCQQFVCEDLMYHSSPEGTICEECYECEPNK
jgi:hypothetical protein